jgi:hypothetical protein
MAWDPLLCLVLIYPHGRARKTEENRLVRLEQERQRMQREADEKVLENRRQREEEKRQLLAISAR